MKAFNAILIDCQPMSFQIRHGASVTFVPFKDDDIISGTTTERLGYANVVRMFFMAFLFFLSPVIKAQQNEQRKADQKLQQAEALYNKMDYINAIKLYEKIAETGDDQFIQLRIASSYKNTGDLPSAEAWYEKASANELPVEHQFAYAEVLMSNGKYEEASKWYKLYAQNAPDDSRPAKKLAAIDNLSGYYKHEDRYTVTPLDINSPYSDFGAAFLQDGIIFASAREEVAPGKRYKRTNSAYLDLYQSTYDEEGNPGQVTKLPKSINSKYHEGPAVVYDDGEKMIFTRNIPNEKGNKEEDYETVRFQLFQTHKTKNGSWSRPELIPFGDGDYSVGHATVSLDGKLLYFSANMPGGEGGTDIYMSRHIDGSWGEPENLGNRINTEGNEMFPFISRDSILYFSSDGKGGLGGLDIYRVILNSEQPAENLGSPVNSGKDDFAFVLHKEGSWGYFSSNRPGGKGDDDLYHFSVKPPEPQPEPQPQPEPELIPQDTIIAEKRQPEKVYTIQILALLNPITVRKSFLQDLLDVLKHDGRDGFHRYTYGEYTGLQEALEKLEEIRDKGYSDAFLRLVERYSELSEGPGRNVEELYITEKRDNQLF